MRFTVSSSALGSRLSALARVINSKNSLPILGDFVFEVEGTTLRLTASDSENTMKTVVELNESDGDGRFAVGSHNLLEAVKGISEQPISFDVNQNDNIAKISYQNGQFSLPIENADEFPMAQEVGDGAKVINMPNNILADNINRSLFATAQDELRPVMNGIYFDLMTDCLAIVASDGHKLVRNKVFSVRDDQPASFILPKKPATLLKNTLDKDDSEVVIRFDERNAEIIFGNTTLQCRLIEGRYPNYNSVIPQDNPNELTIDRKTLIGALRRVLPFASESSQLVRLHLENGKIEVSSEDIDFATSAKEEIACDYSGNTMNIGFKGSSLNEILNNLSSSDVTLQLADPSRPCLIVPVEQPENEEILMLIMPMLLND